MTNGEWRILADIILTLINRKMPKVAVSLRAFFSMKG
jgi:hypothetical protein